MSTLTNVKAALAAVCILLVLGLVWVYLNRYDSATAKFIYQNIPLINQSPDKEAILLLGIAGGAHDGANLTDTVMVAIIDSSARRVNLISIPRDLWIDEITGKVNSAYEKGLSKNDGLGFAKRVVSKFLGIQIDHAIRIDFNGFIEAIDSIGGVEVNVERSFEDYLYPVSGKENDMCGNEEVEVDGKKALKLEDGKIATDSATEDKGYQYFKCRYEHLKFERGLTQMDGVTVLKFVRSRHGSGGEGSDFARAKRQQRALEAIRAKVLSSDSLVNPNGITKAMQALGRSFDSDMSVADMINVYSMVKKDVKILSFVLGGEGGGSLLEHPNPDNFGGAWVLTPRGGDYTLVRNYIQDIINGEIPDGTKKEPNISTRSGNIRF